MFNVAYLALGWKRNVGFCARNEKAEPNRTYKDRFDSAKGAQVPSLCRQKCRKNVNCRQVAAPLKTKPCDKIVEIFRGGLDSVRKSLVLIEAFAGS